MLSLLLVFDHLNSSSLGSPTQRSLSVLQFLIYRVSHTQLSLSLSQFLITQ